MEGDVGIGQHQAVADIGRLRVLPRITHDHLHLNPGSRMRVKLAAQVMMCTDNIHIEHCCDLIYVIYIQLKNSPCFYLIKIEKLKQYVESVHFTRPSLFST